MNLLVSRNARYYLYENRLYDAKYDTNFLLDDLTLPQAIEMIGENLNFKYNEGEILFEEISRFTRQTATRIFECFEESKKLKLMMEYEVKFGSNLLIESNTFGQRKIIQEAWEFLQESVISEWVPQWMKDAGNAIVGGAKKLYSYGKEKFGQAVDWVKEKAAQATKWLISKGVPTIMEGIRAVMFSWGGAIVSTILAVIPGLNVINIVAWGALLLWDVFEAINGRTNWMYIILDIIGIVFSGGMAKGLMTAIGKGISWVGKGLGSVVQAISKTTVGKTIMSGLGTLINGAGKVVKMAADAIAWLANKFGITKFNSVGDSVKAFFDKIVNAFKGTAPATSTATKAATTKTTQAVAKQTTKPNIYQTVKQKIAPVTNAKFGTSTVGKTASTAALVGGGAYALSNKEGRENMFGVNPIKKQEKLMQGIDELPDVEIEVA